MAKAKNKKPPQKQKQKVKVKAKRGAKKSFYEVKAPLTAAKIHLYSTGLEELDGRIVKLDLSKSLRGKAFELKLKVEVEGEDLEGVPVSLALAGSYIRRVMRRGTDYVEDSFESECRDSKAKVKPFFITRHKVSRAVRRALRNLARKELGSYLKTRTSREIFSEIMANKLQRQLSIKLRKIYPLALCEIRVFEILEEK